MKPMKLLLAAASALTPTAVEIGAYDAHFEQKDGDDIPSDPVEAVATIATSLEAFRKSHDEQIEELRKKGTSDPVLEEKLGKIQADLDKATEAKTALEASIEAEKKEREDLELRMQRLSIKGDGDGAKAELELKETNLALAALANERRFDFNPLDQKGLDEYKEAAASYMRYGEKRLSDEQRKAMSVGEDADGGYLVTPDTSGRMVKKIFETSDIRQIASVQVISTDKLEGDNDLDEAGAGWVGETQDRSDTDTPQLGKWEIPVHEMFAQPKATQKLLDDASVNVENWLGDKVGARFGRLENTAFVTGNGVRKPRGFASYAMVQDDGTGVDWGSIGFIKSGANGAFPSSNPADKIYDLIGLLKAGLLTGSRFVTRRQVITLIRKFKSGDGQYLWQPSLVMGQPEQLAGYGITRAEDLAELGAGSASLFFGNFSEGYQIVDRQGTRTLRDPYTDKPFVKFYSTRRVGAGVVNFEAIKAMKFEN